MAGGGGRVVRTAWTGSVWLEFALSALLCCEFALPIALF
jgi:hypothetical protein